MRRFAALFQALDATTRTEAKVQALVDWMRQAPAEDAAWGVYLLAGGRPRRTIPTAVMRAQAQAAAGLPDWLFEASYAAVGDLAETIAKVLPPPVQLDDIGLAEWMTERLLPLRGASPQAQAQALQDWWSRLEPDGRFLLVKLIGGGFRVGVSRGLVQRAVARHAGLDEPLVAQRMMGWTDSRSTPSAARWAQLTAPAQAEETATDGRPLPFYLAHALPHGWDPEATDGPRPDLGPASHWMAEWKYDGIRAQIVRRAGAVWIWSRGEELMAGRFPEVEALAARLPEGVVLDGELLVWREGEERPGAFQALQTRIQRKALSRRLLADAPVRFLAYDLLAVDGADWRARPLHERRARLERLLADGPFACAGPLALPPGGGWADWARLRVGARERGMEGLMLKHRDAPYGVGRTKAADLAEGGWWKWKLDPLEVDGVLIYAQAGHGRRAGLYTDYTFALWNRPPHDSAEAQAVVEAIARREPADPAGLQLVAFTKAYSGLTDAEFTEVDRLIRASTLERFGPVRSVKPSLVVTLGFEGVQRSTRHKSGVALRFPRMLRLRPDKPLHEADDLGHLQRWLGPE